jgi:hypothetical protein
MLDRLAPKTSRGTDAPLLLLGEAGGQNVAVP